MITNPTLEELAADPEFDASFAPDLMLLLGAAAEVSDVGAVRERWPLSHKYGDRLADHLAAAKAQGGLPGMLIERARQGARRVWPDLPFAAILEPYVTATPSVVVDSADPLTHVARRIRSLRADPSAADARDAVVDALRSGALHDAVVRGAGEYREGVDSDVDAWIALALEARLVLDDLAATDDEVLVACADIDTDLATSGDALFLLAPDLYDGIVEGAHLDPEAWWGHREAHADRLARSRWHGLMERISVGQQDLRGGDVGLQPRPRRSTLARDEAATAWAAPLERAQANSHVGAASWLAEHSVRIPLLLWRDDGKGVVADVVLRHDPEGQFWSFDHPLKATAFLAMRKAWRLAAARMPHGRARWAFHEHRVQVNGLDPGVRVDGDSLALPVALAFVALWLGQDLPSDLIATGGLGQSGTVREVRYVPEKTAALALAWKRDGRPRLLVPMAQVTPHERVEVIGVEALAAALACASLDPARAGRFERGASSGASRVAEVARLIACVENQEIDEWRKIPGADPWALLADELFERVLTIDPYDIVLAARGRAAAATAYTHAGERAKELFHGVNPDMLPPEVGVLLQVAELGDHVDEVTLVGARDDVLRRCDRLLAAVDQVHPAHRPMVAGKATGAVGLARLHLRDPAVALPLLRKAVDLHLPAERGRGRVYVSMALRAMGQLEEALAELDRAHADFAHTREHSAPYAVQCLMYWHYERARVLVALARPEEAVIDAQYAIAMADGVFWPRFGILRILVQALRLSGRHDEASMYLGRMYSETVPDKLRAFADRLIAEAQGPPSLSGEVY